MNQCESCVRAIKKMCSREFSSLSEYQPVAYLWMASGSFLDTGVSLPSGARGAMKFNIIANGLGHGAGAKDDTTSKYNRNYFNFWYDTGIKKNIIGMGAGGYNSRHPLYTLNTRYAVSYNTPEHTAVINGTSYNFDNYGWLDAQSPPYSRWTWGLHASLNASTGVHSGCTGESIIYYYRLYDHNGVLKRDLHPVVRKSDNVAGMYDTVSRTMFTNEGTGKFTPGPSIGCLPDTYQQVEYLQSSGTQHIVTSVAIAPTVETRCLGEFTGSNAASVSLIGGRNNNNNNGRYIPLSINANNTSKLRWSYGTSQVNSSYNAYTINNIIYNDASHKVYLNDTQVMNAGSTTLNTNSQQNITLFGMSGYSGVDWRAKGRLYHVSFYNNTTGAKLGDYIPCYRKSDSKPGMYDLVTKTFFVNGGTGEFTVGANI